MVVVRNTISSLRAGGPRQFGQIRNKVIIVSDNKEQQDTASSEVSDVGLAPRKLESAPVTVVEPRSSLTDVLQQLSNRFESRSVLSDAISELSDAAGSGGGVVTSTPALTTATDVMLDVIDSIEGVSSSSFVQTFCDYGPENLRMSPFDLPDIPLDEAEEELQTMDDLNSKYGVNDAHDIERGNQATVCIFDTGYARGLIDESRIRDTFHGDDVGSVYASEEGHGTMCAGAAAASKDDGVPYNGTAPDADVMLVRITDSNGQIRSDYISQAWDWLIQKNTDKPIVVNHSYGTPLCSGRPKQRFCDTAETRMINRANADANITSVYAAGNEAMRCFPAGTKIRTSRGRKSIEDINVGEQVVTHRGNLARVYDTMCRRSDDTMLTISPKYGESFTCTEDHPILVRSASSIFEDGDGTRWKEAKDITVEDELVIPRVKEDERVPDTISVPKSEHGGQKENWNEVMALRIAEGCGPKRLHEQTGVPVGTIQSWIYRGVTPRDIIELPEEVEIDDEIARLIGYYVAEGHADKNRVSFGLHEDEADIMDDIKNIVHTKFSSEIKVNERNKEGKSVSFEVNSTRLAKMFKELCGVGSEDKHFPHWALFHDEGILSEMLKGYYKGDGWSKIPSRHSISSQSEELAYQFKMMTARLGAVTGLSRTEGGDMSQIYGREVERGGDRFKVYSSKGRTSTRVINNVTGVAIADGAKTAQPTNSDITEDNVFVEVDSIERSEDVDYVYNIEVENEHSYVVNGVAVHNCGHRLSGITSGITGTNSISGVITSGALRFDGRDAQRYSSHGRGDCAPVSDPKPNTTFPLPMKVYYGKEGGWGIKDMSIGVGGSAGGTSHASPSTTGIVALLQSRSMKRRGQAMQTQEVKQILQQTAEPPRVTQVNAFGAIIGRKGYDARFGNGIVKPVEALNEV